MSAAPAAAHVGSWVLIAGTVLGTRTAARVFVRRAARRRATTAAHFTATPTADGHMRQRPRAEPIDAATWGNK